MRIPLAAAVLLAAVPSFAGDLGASVTFGRRGTQVFSVPDAGRGPRVMYVSGASDPIPGTWDTVLIQGELPDPGLVLEAARPNPDGKPAWKALDVHAFENGRFWAKAVLPRAAGPLLLRALDAGGHRGQTVQFYTVEVFADEPEAPGAEEAAPPRGPRDPNAVRPPLHLRAEWKAVKPKTAYTPDPNPWRITLHHSEGRHTTTLAESLAETKVIQDFHINGRKWNDIAYHFVIDAAGNIVEARPEGTLGAHAGNVPLNTGNVGIVFLGNYHPPQNDKPTQAQLDAFVKLSRYLVKRYGILPASLKGHRDLHSTDCPGDILYAKLDALRGALGGGQVPPPLALREMPRPPLGLLRLPNWDGAAGARR
jgi:hypothetical protein